MRKRVFLLFLILMFVSALGFSQSITVTSPHSGDTWYKGHTYTITWTKSGSMDSQVKITLYKPDLTTLQMIIVRPTNNDGSYPWHIPSSLPSGQYVVRVKTMDNAVYDNSGVFTITTPPPAGASITVTNPNSGDCWKKGQTHTIRWTKSGSMDSQVKITLYKPDLTTLQMIIVRPTNNDGSYHWFIPSYVPEGQYVIRVKTMDNAVYDNSGIFQIKSSCSSGGGTGAPHIDPWIIEKIRLARPIFGWGPWGPIGPEGPGPLCPQCIRLDISRIREIATPPETVLKRGGETVPVQIFLFQGEEPLTEVGEITPDGKLRLNGRFSTRNRNMMTINVGKEVKLSEGELKLVFKNAETGKIINSVPISIRNRKGIR